jgi:hypothetical protein
MALLRRGGTGAWTEPATTSYSNEAALQRLLAESPGLLYRVDADRAIVATELVIPGSIRPDLTIVQADGSITLVECKLGTNPEIRRAIVGQILSYAAALTGWSISDLTIAWRSSTGKDLVAAMAAQMGGDDTQDFLREDFAAALGANLAGGRFRLILAVDHATEELRNIVGFLNRKSADDLEVVCVEFGYIQDGDLEILIPTTYGVESAARNATREIRHNQAEFRAALHDQTSAQVAAAVEDLLVHAMEKDSAQPVYWGVGVDPSATVSFTLANGQTVQPWTFYLAGSGTPGLAINFDWIYKRGKGATREATDAFADAIAQLPGIAARVADARANDWRKRPTIAADPLFADPNAVRVLIDALDGLLAAPGR